ncbi:HXXEE domain-containing protein [Pseudarthrobacter sp. NamB4]|uniref:HXXEE domain-containing protein n=1 Tax=Pseudarthrobacter sp. NamB4 TaxID=2576837 RepID=UPI00148568AA|nr:HXXEE domain-containing protein [Pseudarthrobacter sp. NamB4]
MAKPQELRNRAWRRGPAWLFLAWALHDLEEAATFPASCNYLADRTGIHALRMDLRQSWAGVGLMGVLVGFACVRGAQTAGSSRLYRAVVAGLGVHVGTHLGATVLARRYTAGVVTAVPVMLPGVIAAGRDLARSGTPLRARDQVMGAVVLVPAAFVCHFIVRMAMRRRAN